MHKRRKQLTLGDAPDEVGDMLIELVWLLQVQQVPGAGHHHLPGVQHRAIQQIGNLATRGYVMLSRQDQSWHLNVGKAPHGKKVLRTSPSASRVLTGGLLDAGV